ncbi:hypothetical protein FIM10_05100 [Sphingomonadales bacterium 56]|uniref:Uncharacterized protein n=1 Tax=Sphingobium agri TaxID=2933566 RepID=A0ABT0DVP6_9SPHN|nr:MULTISPECIES: hypothetical protein [Sphingomonadaceae]MBY2928051.1 hypothetical protein [Sphingomonadales bacterium 56]MBY2958151.1 hypothetical protein [Sphingomonadales bacterium 58]MCK0531185.1 hypothetical protein [Sphingobium agri]CAD7336470.1 hypothetical protein SPHS6_01031 [Sphingobium sp. S6]CAD7336531.1 hypothetical protein SPHS8_01070 [Sphingobium sp. S8]
MKGLLKLAFIGGLSAVAWRAWQDRHAPAPADDRGPVGSSGIVRDAGPEEQHIDASDWDMVDEQVDESFPASDPPGNY